MTGVTRDMLVGRTITAVQIAEDRESVRFRTTSGDVELRVYGD